MSIHRESPFLRRAATVRRVDALFQAMSNDFLLRQQFVTNPTRLLSEYVHGIELSAEQSSASNQLLYAVLSDRKILDWLHSYTRERRGDVPSGDVFVNDFAQAVVDRGARHTVLALIRSSVGGKGLAGFDEDVLHFIFNIGRFADVGGDGGTGDGGTGDGGTGGDGGTSTLTAVTWSTYIITHPQAEVDNSFSARQSRQFAPPYVMVTLDELAAYAATLRDNGALELSFETSRPVRQD